MNQPQGRFVIDRLGGHRTDQADIVGNRTGVRQQLAEFHATLPVLVKLVRAAEHISLLLVEVSFQRSTGIGLAVPFLEFRLRIEQIHLAGTAMLKQADHRFGLFARHSTRCFSGGRHRLQQTGQGDRTDSGRLGSQKCPSSHRRPVGRQVHVG